jgi:hypothetical protein
MDRYEVEVRHAGRPELGDRLRQPAAESGEPDLQFGMLRFPIRAAALPGGTAAVLHQNSKGIALWEDKCEKLSSAKKFYSFLSNGASNCDHFKHDPNKSGSHICENCLRYHHFDITSVLHSNQE